MLTSNKREMVQLIAIYFRAGTFYVTTSSYIERLGR